MIKINELRIGNKIYYKGDENDLVYTITEAVELDTVSDNPLYTPIGLTPEILEKAGFTEPRRTIRRWRLKTVTIQISGSGGRLYYALPGGWTITIQHVHQLQNLYFALTGEELQITL